MRNVCPNKLSLYFGMMVNLYSWHQVCPNEQTFYFGVAVSLCCSHKVCPNELSLFWCGGQSILLTQYFPEGGHRRTLIRVSNRSCVPVPFDEATLSCSAWGLIAAEKFDDTVVLLPQGWRNRNFMVMWFREEKQSDTDHSSFSRTPCSMWPSCFKHAVSSHSKFFLIFFLIFTTIDILWQDKYIYIHIYMPHSEVCK